MSSSGSTPRTPEMPWRLLESGGTACSHSCRGAGPITEVMAGLGLGRFPEGVTLGILPMLWGPEMTSPRPQLDQSLLGRILIRNLQLLQRLSRCPLCRSFYSPFCRLLRYGSYPSSLVLFFTALLYLRVAAFLWVGTSVVAVNAMLQVGSRHDLGIELRRAQYLVSVVIHFHAPFFAHVASKLLDRDQKVLLPPPKKAPSAHV